MRPLLHEREEKTYRSLHVHFANARPFSRMRKRKPELVKSDASAITPSQILVLKNKLQTIIYNCIEFCDIISKLAIVLQLNGHWDSIGRYRDFNVDGIIVNEDSNYSQLNSAIAEHLMIDTSTKIIEIKYTVNERCPPMEILNDMGVRVYMETKKENKSLGMYLICITVRDVDLECSISNSSTIAATASYVLEKIVHGTSSPPA
nr:uncharacterized protein LOC117275062 [Nicotiana tomentosiformis]